MLDVAQRLARVEAHPQHHRPPQPGRGQQDHDQRIDVEQRQHAERHLRVGPAVGPVRPLPHRGDGGEQVAVAQHRALGQAGGAAGVLQQRHVVGIAVERGLGRRRPRRPVGEADHVRPPRRLGQRRGERAPVVLVAQDHPLARALVEQPHRHVGHLGQVEGDQGLRARILDLVGQHPHRIEGAEHRHPQVRGQRPEEGRRVEGRVGQVDRHRVAPPQPVAPEGVGDLPGPPGERVPGQRGLPVDQRHASGVAEGGG